MLGFGAVQQEARVSERQSRTDFVARGGQLQAAPYLAGIANPLSQRWVSTLINATTH